MSVGIRVAAGWIERYLTKVDKALPSVSAPENGCLNRNVFPLIFLPSLPSRKVMSYRSRVALLTSLAWREQCRQGVGFDVHGLTGLAMRDRTTTMLIATEPTPLTRRSWSTGTKPGAERSNPSRELTAGRDGHQPFMVMDGGCWLRVDLQTPC